MSRLHATGARPKVAGLFRVVLAGVTVTACGGETAGSAADAETPTARLAADERVFASLDDFLGGYWNRPIPPQGAAPEGWPELESSFEPGQCGTCHVSQYADWQTTIHSDAYSPGLSGQLVSREDSDFGFVRGCLACHSPLSEQNAKLSLPGGGFGLNPDYQPELKKKGLVCAACHVRGHVRHGPPTREGSTAPSADGMPHGGVVRSEYFEDSRFCSGCHQFASPAPNGKSLQNTYEEWLDSRYAAEGVSCQTCHMPDRRHLWRGIHDPEMVRSGVTIEWVAAAPGTVGLRVVNSGTGHRFPTYVTPAVDVQIEVLDPDQSPVPDVSASAEISRRVGLREGQWVEFEDTRLAPDSSLTVTLSVPSEARFARGLVRVRPDAFYRNVFAGLLSGTLTDSARVLIDEAHGRSIASPFTIFDDTVEIAP